MNRYRMIGNVRLLCVALALAAGSLVSAAPNLRDVDCGKESLGTALGKAGPGDTLRVTGICRERVVITTDGLTLDGQGTAVLDGGGADGNPFTATLLIDGARGVTVRGFTIRNSQGAILAQSNATFKMQNTTCQDNVDGVLITNGSIGEIIDSTLTHNTDAGMGVINGSLVAFKGSVKVNNNKFDGLVVNGNSSLEIREGSLEVSGNGGNGIFLILSKLGNGIGCSFSSCRITVNDNGGDGIFLGGSQLNIGGNANAAPGSTVVTAMSNKGSGISVQADSSLINISAGRFALKGNAIGLNVGNQSLLFMIGGLDVQTNGTGLLADAAGTLTLISIPPNPSTIRNNTAADADLRFGTRITVDGLTFGTALKCDGTVLSRGSTKCP